MPTKEASQRTAGFLDFSPPTADRNDNLLHEDIPAYLYVIE